MDSEDEPRRVIERIYEAMAARDLDTILELADPDLVIIQDPALPWGGRFEGVDGFGQFTMALLGTIDSQVTTDALFQAGEHVVQHGRTAGTVRANGATFDIAECHVWRVVDGKAVEAQFFIDSAAMLAAIAG